MSDLLRTMAAVFLRKGAADLSTMDVKHALSLDLRWFAPADARKLLQHAADAGVVTVDGDRVRPAFDPKGVDVPVGFRPTVAILDERPEMPAPAASASPDAPAAPAPAPPSFKDRVLAEAAAASGADPATLRQAFEEEKRRRAGALTDDVVALLVARRRGLDAAPLAEEALTERGGGSADASRTSDERHPQAG